MASPRRSVVPPGERRRYTTMSGRSVPGPGGSTPRGLSVGRRIGSYHLTRSVPAAQEVFLELVRQLHQCIRRGVRVRPVGWAMACGVSSCSKQQARSGCECSESAITGEAVSLACPAEAGAAEVIAIDLIWSVCRHITAAADVVKVTVPASVITAASGNSCQERAGGPGYGQPIPDPAIISCPLPNREFPMHQGGVLPGHQGLMEQPFHGLGSGREEACRAGIVL